MITSKTLPIFLIGNPVSHSLSPVFQNAALKYADIDAVYLTINIEKENFEKVISGLKKIKLMGLNITLPYKTEIVKYADELSEEATTIGAVNTIQIKNDKWIGHNTDWYGIYESLKIKRIKPDFNALIFGSGGSTPAIIYALKKYGFKKIAVSNRTMEKALFLREKFDVSILDYKEKDNYLNDFKLIFNSTSTDFNEIITKININTIYYDLNYYRTKLKTKNYIDGILMLLLQGLKSLEIWSGKKVPLKVALNAIKRYKKIEKL